MSNTNDFFAEQENDPEYRIEVILAEVAMSVAKELKAVRESKQISQSELAEMLKVKQSQVSRMENPAQAKYSLRTLAEIADALNLDLRVDLTQKGQTQSDKVSPSPRTNLRKISPQYLNESTQ